MGVDFWSPLREFIRDTMLPAGTVGEGEIASFWTDDPAAAVAYINETST